MILFGEGNANRPRLGDLVTVSSNALPSFVGVSSESAACVENTTSAPSSPSISIIADDDALGDVDADVALYLTLAFPTVRFSVTYAVFPRAASNVNASSNVKHNSGYLPTFFVGIASSFNSV
jgi:hypothetical protein